MKICKIEPPDLLFLAVFISYYINRYIIFHKFLELHSILSVKKIFVTIFFFNGFTQTPTPSPTWRKFFVDAPLRFMISNKFYYIYIYTSKLLK